MNLRRRPPALFGAVLVCALALTASAAAPARAQQPLNPHEKGWVEPPPSATPRTRAPAQDLDFLFGALKAAPDETSAKAIEDRIWAHWLASGSDTVTLLMARAKMAIEKENYDTALRVLDAVIEIRPQFAEAWNRRATVFYLKKDYSSALADLGQTLRREPRHFAALAGLGAIMQDLGDDKHALEAFRQATALNPRLKGMEERIRTLADKVDGRPI
jgi:tetratricopeptide (TPR) repeat protein